MLYSFVVIAWFGSVSGSNVSQDAKRYKDEYCKGITIPTTMDSTDSEIIHALTGGDDALSNV